jgi:N-acetylglucosamine-6-phosphate deacetylase
MFVDLQVNGYAGVDFNADRLDGAGVAEACQRLKTDGVTGILATIITADLPAMCRRLQNICRIRQQDRTVAAIVWGIHIEGPFLNKEHGYIGAHPSDVARPAEANAMKQLLDAAEGLTRIVTLAPECDDGARVTRMLADQGITVSAGHCNPDHDTLMACIDAGLSMFTHLGNGCPLMLHRHDNIIQRVLALSRHLAIGFIADGVHVPYAALGNYLAVTGFERAFVVTDAIAAAGCGPGVFQLGDRAVVVDEELATWSTDRQHLVGSASTMPVVVQRLRERLGLSDHQTRQLTYSNPRRAIGMDS